MHIDRRVVNVCPKCKNNLRLVIESENKPKIVSMKYTYICDVCRFKKIIENVIIKMDSDKIIITKKVGETLS
ncbi:MAG: hypothetical protein QW101_03995 [Ignisphaera sp.]|uniref:Uncharacterized protein n=1 Tax=Ignisphaera aggregans TaxID=334771 RepID=A0A7J3N0E6_9CREN